MQRMTLLQVLRTPNATIDSVFVHVEPAAARLQGSASGCWLRDRRKMPQFRFLLLPADFHLSLTCLPPAELESLLPSRRPSLYVILTCSDHSYLGVRRVGVVRLLDLDPTFLMHEGRPFPFASVVHAHCR